MINYPNALNIFLTNRCNLNCQYCFVNKEGGKKELNIDFFKKGIDLFWRFPGKYKTISFNGGEPLLRFGKIKGLYEYIWRKNEKQRIKIVTAVMSNGTLLTKSRYRFLEDNKIILKISIDGTKESHDFNRPFKLRKYGSSYERILDNLKQCRNGRDRKYKICASLVFTPGAIRGLVKNIKFLWSEAGFDYIDFYPDLYAQWQGKELERLENEFQKFTAFYINIFKKYNKKQDIFENSLLHTFVKEIDIYKPVHCRKIHLDSQGKFYCCDKVFSLPYPERKKFLIGSTEQGIDNRLRIRLLEQKRKEIRSLTGKDCSVCKYMKYCFCPIGHFIYFSFAGLDFKQYFPQFCRVSQAYIRSFSEIKNRLIPNPLFAKIYLN